MTTRRWTSRSRPVTASVLCACVLLGFQCLVTMAAPPASKAPRNRNIFRKEIPNDAKVIGLYFKVLTLDKNSSPMEVDHESHPFHVGDSFLVQIKPQDDVYVYVFTEGPEGDKDCLLPRPGEPHLLVKADSEISLPDDGSWFEFKPPAGDEKLVVVALKEPSTDLALLQAAAFKKPVKTLSSQEKAEKDRAEAAISQLRDRASRGIKTRGPTKKYMNSLAGKEPESASQTVTHTEPPNREEGEDSTLVITRAGEQAGPPELIIDIPLRSRVAPGN